MENDNGDKVGKSVSLENGAGVKHALQGWVIVLFGARTLVGRPNVQVGPDDGYLFLSPAYDLTIEKIPVQTAQGMGIQEQHSVKPVAQLVGITHLRLPLVAIAMIDGTTLSRREQVGLRVMITGVENAIAAAKRAEAGEVLGEKMKAEKKFGGGARE